MVGDEPDAPKLLLEREAIVRRLKELNQVAQLLSEPTYFATAIPPVQGKLNFPPSFLNLGFLP